MKGKRKGIFRRILPILILVASVIVFAIFVFIEIFHKPIIGNLFSNYFWLGLFISLIAEAVFLGALGKTILPWISWRWRKFIFNRFVTVKISAYTKYNLNRQLSIDDYLNTIKKISNLAFENIEHEQEETPADYWIQISLGNQNYGVSFRACCLDSDPLQYSKIEIKINNEISFRTFYDAIINIQSIINKVHLGLHHAFENNIDLDNIVFEVSPLGQVLIENYWFKQVSKDQVLKVETKDGYEILLFEDKAQLCVKEFTSSIREYLENLMISSYEKSQT